MKKGFTLVELICVIVLLGLVSLIAVPLILNAVNNKSGDIDEATKKIIYQATELYISNYNEDYTKNGRYCLKLSKLMELEYLPNDLKYAMSNEEISKDNFVKIYIDNKKYAYEISSECSSYIYQYTGELVQGAEYVDGQYTYRYMQEGTPSGWKNIEKEGWGVKLTDKESTDPVTTKLLSSINDKPIVSMSSMFENSQATSIDLTSFDTSNVINMSSMFSNSNATNIDLSNFNTAKVTNMASMFSYEGEYEWSVINRTIIGLTNIDTSNVTSMNNMFERNDIENLDLTSFDTSNVINMSHMFWYAFISQLDLTSFDISNVTDMTDMFNSTSVNTAYVKSQADADRFISDGGASFTFTVMQ